MQLITTGDGRFKKQIPEDESHFNKMSLFLFNRSVLFCDLLDCSPPQSPLSMGFPRQEYWSGLPFPSPGDLPDPGIEPESPALHEDPLPLSHQRSPALMTFFLLNIKVYINTSEHFSDKRSSPLKNLLEWERERVGRFGRMALKHVKYHV